MTCIATGSLPTIRNLSTPDLKHRLNEQRHDIFRGQHCIGCYSYTCPNPRRVYNLMLDELATR